MNLLNRVCLAVIAVVLLCASPCLAQDWAKKMFNEVSHDFGTVTKGTRPTHTFEITNLYEERLQILGVTSSCGCTTPTLSKLQIESGETIQLNCQFNSEVGVGHKQATVTVRFAEPFPGEVQVAVAGMIRNDVVLQPAQLDFGVFQAGNSPTLTTSITQFGNPNWQVLDIRSLYSDITVGLQQRHRGRDQVIYDITAQVKDTAQAGRVQGELIVVTTDGRIQSQVTVPFTGKVASSLTVNPDVLTLGDVQVGEKLGRKVILKGEQPFRLVDVTCDNLDFSVVADGKEKKVHFVEVLFTGSEAGNFNTELTFVTDLNGETSAKMQAIVNVTPQAAENKSTAIER